MQWMEYNSAIKRNEIVLFAEMRTDLETVIDEINQKEKNITYMWNLPEKETATHFRILAWRIPWTEEPGRLQSMESQKVGHNYAIIPHM